MTLTVTLPCVDRYSQATILSVEPGQTLDGLRIRLKTVSAHRISGQYAASLGDTKQIKIRLYPAADPDQYTEPAEQGSISAEGEFPVADVSSGDYFLRLSRITTNSKQPGAHFDLVLASQRVVVGESDIQGLTLIRTIGLPVSGEVVTDDGSLPDVAAGTFRFSDLDPLSYTVEVLPPERTKARLSPCACWKVTPWSRSFLDSAFKLSSGRRNIPELREVNDRELIRATNLGTATVLLELEGLCFCLTRCSTRRGRITRPGR